MKILLFVLSGVILAMVQGCAYFTRPLERPVIEDSMRRSFLDPAKIGILSLTPERRIVLQNMQNGKFCAENPTETGIDMASALKVAAAGDLTPDRKAELSLALTAASNNYVLNRRTQGMQIFQSASYNLCQFYLNSELSTEEYLKAQQYVLDKAASLIELELKTPIAVQNSATKERSAGDSVSTMESSTATGAAATENSSAQSKTKDSNRVKALPISPPASAPSTLK